MKAETRDKFSPFERFAVKVIEKKFGALAQNCEHRFHDKKELPNCAYHPSSIGFCQFEFCPRLRPKQSERGDKNEVEHKEEKSNERLERRRLSQN